MYRTLFLSLFGLLCYLPLLAQEIDPMPAVERIAGFTLIVWMVLAGRLLMRRGRGERLGWEGSRSQIA